MPRFSSRELGRYLLNGELSRRGCLRHRLAPTYLRSSSPTTAGTTWHRSSLARTLHTAPQSEPEPPRHVLPVPPRIKLKEQKKARKKAAQSSPAETVQQRVDGWELSVAATVHARLVTQTLDQAVRAALALNCVVQRSSRWELEGRANGVGLVQLEPFAKDGYVDLFSRDGIAEENWAAFRVGIQELRLQDGSPWTESTVKATGTETLPTHSLLARITSQPVLQTPEMATAFVRKIQRLFNAVDCVSKMYLSADITVSVRRTEDLAPPQRHVEVRNLTSLKDIENAILYERHRQITTLEAGDTVLPDIKGWRAEGTPGTFSLPEITLAPSHIHERTPVLKPVEVDQEFVAEVRSTMGRLPDEQIDHLMTEYKLPEADATSLAWLEQGGRVAFYYQVVSALETRLQSEGISPAGSGSRRLACTWVLHELSHLTSERQAVDLAMQRTGECAVAVADMADLLQHLHRGRITPVAARELLQALARGELGWCDGVTDAIEKLQLWYRPLTEEGYGALARRVWEEHAEVQEAFRAREGEVAEKALQSKFGFLVGQMVQSAPAGQIHPVKARDALRAIVVAERESAA